MYRQYIPNENLSSFLLFATVYLEVCLHLINIVVKHTITEIIKVLIPPYPKLFLNHKLTIRKVPLLK